MCSLDWSSQHFHSHQCSSLELHFRKWQTVAFQCTKSDIQLCFGFFLLVNTTEPSLRTIPFQHHDFIMECIIHLPFPTLLLIPPHNWHPSSLHTPGCPYYSAIIPLPHPRTMCQAIPKSWHGITQKAPVRYNIKSPCKGKKRCQKMLAGTAEWV